MSVAAWVMFGLFFLWSFLGMPIGHAMMAAAFVYLIWTGQDLAIVASQSLSGLFNSFVLMSVPLFILSADIMNASKITDRLFEFANLLVGRMRGGLAHVNVVASMIFSGMSGSALADAAGPGKLEVDMMIKAGYSPGFSAALSATSAIIGPIIPPSIPMVIYGVVSNTSIGFLFIAGVIPGLLLGFTQMGIVAIIARKRNFPVEAKPTRPEAVRTLKTALPALLLPVIMLGGIYSGAVTPTEAAAVAAAYALLLAVFWYQTLNFGKFVNVLIDSSRSTAIVAITIAGALVMNWIVAAEQIPEAMGAWMISLDMSPVMFLLAVNILFLFLGAFLDTMLMLLIVVPILMPTVVNLGIDPVHFGVTSVINMMIGLVTPPMGELVFLISGVSGVPVAAISKELWGFLIALIGLLFVLVYVPEITLWLPVQMGYQPIHAVP
ncbi:MAG: TRAP transporter large permease [Rhodospirillaceae bacterium]|nr:TRAP transporter large permease [Rhodospirillaceae bacterium]